MTDAAAPSGSAAAAAEAAGASAPALAHTGKYQLAAVLTHKGRSADSGHYVAWVRQPDGKSWMLYDDDTVTPKTEEDILKLDGGGDWHTAYLLLYQAVKAPAGGSA